jgi:hypothetical protein
MMLTDIVHRASLLWYTCFAVIFYGKEIHISKEFQKILRAILIKNAKVKLGLKLIKNGMREMKTELKV